jgi:SOS regulatory protein LexA
MPKRIDISERASQLRAFYAKEGRAPSYAELATLFGYQTKSAVYRPVDQLIERGYLRRCANGRLSFTQKITGSIPLLGSVTAGFPSPAEEELIDTINLDEFLVTRPEATYLLTVSGDSMIDAGIHPGDMVLVEKGGVPKMGDIVIAQVDGEWTMKYFGKDATGVFLDPANAGYGRIRPAQSMLIGGIVKAVIRKYT